MSRTEADIFSDLVRLSSSSGFAHVIAFLEYEASRVYDRETPLEMLTQQEKLSICIPNEISMLTGCMCKSEIDWTIPTPEQLGIMIKEAKHLLDEIHKIIVNDAILEIKKEPTEFLNAKTLREIIFYEAREAYPYQYPDMAHQRYIKDADWLEEHKGYTPDDAKSICNSILKWKFEKITENSTPFEACLLNIDAITSQSGVDKIKVTKFLNVYSVSENNRNCNFTGIDAFNLINATPIIRTQQGNFILFQYSRLLEATYVSPYYWLIEDDNYKVTASENRGRFTEDFLFNRLKLKFEEKNIYRNLDIYKGKKRIGEIDCLVIFGDHALLFQAKSKISTLEARKGNIEKLEDDFRLAIQEAYDQAIKCGKSLSEKNIVIKHKNGKIKLPEIKHLYPVCVISDYYPAVYPQARKFLNFVENEFLSSPFICSLFVLDILIEILPSPLRFLSYIYLRTRFYEKLHASHEFNVLGYFLSKNLWIEESTDVLLIDENCSQVIDRAILHKEIPEGILTKIKDTKFGKIIQQIEFSPELASLGLLLLQFGETAIINYSSALEKFIEDSRKIGRPHDMTIPIPEERSGLTIHCNISHQKMAKEHLAAHARMKKYQAKAERWYGILLNPISEKIQAFLIDHYPYEYDEDIEKAISILRLNQSKIVQPARLKLPKIGRNDPCYCGSGRKYKKCCHR